MNNRIIHIGNAVHIMDMLTYYIINDWSVDDVDFLIIGV